MNGNPKHGIYVRGVLREPMPVRSEQKPRFNVRAYGIWINSQGDVLVSDESHRGQRICKFPGGGLLYGEGLVDCLKREWMEETGLSPRIVRHYYTTDFFQPSAFAPDEQVLSVYYLVSCEENLVSVRSLEGLHQFRWVPLAALAQGCMTLPIDRRVAEQLNADFAETLARVA